MKPAHQRLDELMRDRRFALGLRTWRALSERAGISYETLRAVRSGGNPGPATVDGLERALQWTPGSIDAILGGGEPTVRGDLHDSAHATDGLTVEREPSLHELAEQMRALREEIEELRERDRRREEAEAVRRREQRSG